jgi:hypothetical protein
MNDYVKETADVFAHIVHVSSKTYLIPSQNHIKYLLEQLDMV